MSKALFVFLADTKKRLGLVLEQNSLGTQLALAGWKLLANFTSRREIEARV